MTVHRARTRRKMALQRESGDMAEVNWTEILVAGVVVAIPVGIVVNLLTNPVQRKLEKRLKRQAARREQERGKFQSQVADLAADRAAFQVFLSTQILRTTYFTALFGFASALAFAMGQVTLSIDVGQGWRLGNVFIVVGQLTALLGSLIVLTVVRSALQTASAVRAGRGRRATAADVDGQDVT